MEKIKISHLLFSGLLAAFAFLIAEFIIEGLVKVIFNFNEVDLAREYFPGIILNGARYQIVNICYLICICIATIWLYTSLIPKFGKGFKTALIASSFVIIIIFLFMVNHINMGIFPFKPALISFAFSIIEFPFAIVAGASVYKSE
ncbi:hypothetical protein LJE86_02885 [bacterium BMS3Abin03]|nr:hypothetical protein [bacterium BMS3Abin03]MCG6958451.1 hypothetical protein [bacterium BMS3Abin03]